MRIRTQRRDGSPARAAGPLARRAGLSILEVILSLAILIMSLSAIGLLINMGSEHEMNTRLSNTAARLAQSKLAEVEAGIVTFDTTEGEFADADAGWVWTMTAEEQGANLYLVTVTVARQSGKAFQFTLAQMMLDPEVRGSASRISRPAPDAAPDGGSP